MVEELAGAYLDAVDRALPGLVGGLYLVGSVALGAWQPGCSDVDAAIFTSRAPSAHDLAALREVHAQMPAEPHLDGVYLSPRDGRPVDRRVVPFVLDGVLHTDRPCGELTPVLWLTLQRYGIPVRGPAVRELGIRVDERELRAYNLDNLRTYWRPQADGIRRFVADLDPSTPVDAAYAVWVALGPARLHATLATGDVVSKAGAGAYVTERFPDYAPLAARATRWRAGEPVAFTAEHLSAAASLVELVADDAWAHWG